MDLGVEGKIRSKIAKLDLQRYIYPQECIMPIFNFYNFGEWVNPKVPSDLWKKDIKKKAQSL